MTRLAILAIGLVFAAVMLCADRTIAGWQQCRIAQLEQCPQEVRK